MHQPAARLLDLATGGKKSVFLATGGKIGQRTHRDPTRQTTCLPLDTEGREVGTGSKKRHRRQRADRQTLPVITALGEGHDKSDDDGDGQHDADSGQHQRHDRTAVGLLCVGVLVDESTEVLRGARRIQVGIIVLCHGSDISDSHES